MTTTWSLRSRVRWWTTCAGAAVLIIASLAIYLGIRNDLNKDFDQLLQQRLRILSGLIHIEAGQPSVTVIFDQYPEFLREPYPDFLECRLADGQAFFRSPGLLMRDALLPIPTDLPVGTQLMSLELPDGRQGRAAVMTMASSEPGQESEHHAARASQRITMMLASDTRELEHSLTQVTWLLGSVAVVALIAVALVMDQMARWLITPLDHLAERLATLKSSDLHQRLQADEAPRELMPVVNRLNDLLARLERTVLRERGFSADLAHELRTPLSGLQISLDVALRQVRSPDSYQLTLRECQDICTQMNAMVETMLTLARADSGSMTTRIGPVDVGAVLEGCWRLVDHEARQRGLQVQWDLEPTKALADEAHVRLVANNIFANAVSYANAHGTITISTRHYRGEAVIAVSNTGCTLNPTQSHQVFERFWRGDTSRANTGLHCGLGLTLCRTLITMNDGRIATTIADGRFTITVTLRTPEHITTLPISLKMGDS